MLAVVCQAIFFDFLGNPGFLEKGVRPEILPLPEKTEGRDPIPSRFRFGNLVRTRLVGQMTT